MHRSPPAADKFEFIENRLLLRPRAGWLAFLYLSEQDVKNTLREIKEHSASGSVIVADFYAKQFVTGELHPGMKKGLALLKMTDEELGFGVAFENNDTEEFVSFIESENIKLGNVHYLGSKSKKGTWMAVAQLVV